MQNMSTDWKTIAISCKKNTKQGTMITNYCNFVGVYHVHAVCNE